MFLSIFFNFLKNQHFNFIVFLYHFIIFNFVEFCSNIYFISSPCLKFNLLFFLLFPKVGTYIIDFRSFFYSCMHFMLYISLCIVLAVANSWYFKISLNISSLTHGLIRSTLFTFQLCCGFSSYLSVLYF